MLDNENNEQLITENQPQLDENTPENQPKDETPAPEPEPIPERLSSRNFKVIKDKQLQAERERDELLRMLQEERAKGSKPIPEEDDDIPDDFIEGKHLKKQVKEIRQLRKELLELKQQTRMEITDAKIKAECPDFNKVLTEENVEQFKEEHPELAETIFNSKADPYSIAKSAYKAMKKFGIYVEDNYEKEKQLAQKNLSRIKPSTSLGVRQGDTALSKAGEYVAEELTDERKAMLWKEVQKFSR